MTATELAVEVVGWAGASLILLAYQAMNVVGAAGFIVNGWWHGAIPSAVLNVIWMLIGGIALWRILARRAASEVPDQGPAQ